MSTPSMLPPQAPMAPTLPLLPLVAGGTALLAFVTYASTASLNDLSLVLMVMSLASGVVAAVGWLFRAMREEPLPVVRLSAEELEAVRQRAALRRVSGSDERAWRPVPSRFADLPAIDFFEVPAEPTEDPRALFGTAANDALPRLDRPSVWSDDMIGEIRRG